MARRNSDSRETDMIAYALRHKKPGDIVKLEIVRNGTPQTIALKLP